jgi:hypothetical protein
MIGRAEQALGRRLPAAWRQRLLQANGGSLEIDEEDWELYPVLDDSDQRRLKRTCNHIVRETEEARKWPHFPADAAAVGANGMGDLLVLLPDANDDAFEDVVYVWRHEDGTTEIAEDLDASD